MTICPVALAVGCEKCAIVRICPANSTLGSYRFAHDDMKRTPAIDTSAVVAVLVSPGDHSHDFIETVSRNSGLNVTLFTDRERAVAHLLRE